MRGLSPGQLLDVWERGATASGVERGLLLLSCCLPARSWQDLTTISIGRRNSLLLELRGATFGQVLSGFAVCPACAGQLEFDVDPRQLGLIYAGTDAATVEFEHEGNSLNCRLPDSTDLLAIATCADAEQARSAIASRCLQRSRSEELRGAPEPLPAAAVAAFEACLAEHDPAADISLRLRCPSCCEAWELALDVVAFFWGEIQSAVRRLVLEVDALARSYGWSEAEILGMSSERRNLYLEMVG